jgi:hypothetical protein
LPKDRVVAKVRNPKSHRLRAQPRDLHFRGPFVDMFFGSHTPSKALIKYDPRALIQTNALPVHSWVSRAALTKIRLMFFLATLVANSLTRFVAPVATPPHCYILISGGKAAPLLSRRNSYRRMLQASILTNPVSPVPSVMITVYRLAPRDVQSPFQLPILGPLRLHLCPA